MYSITFLTKNSTIGLSALLLVSKTALASCNGWHSGWCGQHYSAEAAGIRESILPNLSARLSELPIILTAKNQDLYQLNLDNIQLEREISASSAEIEAKKAQCQTLASRSEERRVGKECRL